MSCVFTEDKGFGSPSVGALIVNAGNVNEKSAWKVERTGQTYQERYDEKLKTAGVEDD